MVGACPKAAGKFIFYPHLDESSEGQLFDVSALADKKCGCPVWARTTLRSERRREEEGYAYRAMVGWPPQGPRSI